MPHLPYHLDVEAMCRVEERLDHLFEKGTMLEQGRDGIVAHGFPGTGQGAIQGLTLFKFGRIGQLIF